MAWEVGFENDRVITTVVMDQEEKEKDKPRERRIFLKKSPFPRVF
jgi:hypothetical protein